MDEESYQEAGLVCAVESLFQGFDQGLVVSDRTLLI